MKIERDDILFISASKAILTTVRALFASLQEEYLIYEAALADAVRVARSCIEKSQTKIIISTGGTAELLKQSVSVHVLEMRYRGEDMLEAIHLADPHTHKVAIVGFPSFIHTATRIRNTIPDPLQLKVVNDFDDMRKSIDDLIDQGFDTFVGGSLAVNIAQARGARGVHIGMEREVILDTLNEAKSIVKLLKEKDIRLATNNTLLDAITEGIIGCDRYGNVNSINHTGLLYLERTRDEVMGQDLARLIDIPFLANTLRSGEEYTGGLVRIRENQYSATCVPVFVDGAGIIGAVLTLQELSRLKNLELHVRKSVIDSGHVAKKRFSDIIGSSKAIRKAKEWAQTYAQTDSTVLIYGKTGTGKELFAQSIHNASPRAKAPFVAVNCAALPESLLESELFGYVHGAFTGARTGGKTGLFEMAQGGTIFLDEISEMAPALQSRLLRVCQEREIARIGDSKVIPIDVRVIAAANRDLLTLVQAGSFREDLYYRLSVLILELPTLAKRMEDLDELARHIVHQKAKDLKRSLADLPLESLRELHTLSWPGNVRQLSNVLERAIVITKGRIITAEVIKDALRSCRPFLKENEENPCLLPIATATTQETNEELPTLGEAQDFLIQEALQACHGNQTAAARSLGLSRSTLWRKLKAQKARQGTKPLY